ncbi:MAG: restriction endonuclease subunit S [Mogibacterium sp.]|nr:restriction endonuclease subunit S [Mogibacterium sp.]
MKTMLLEDCCEILDSMRVPITAANREEGPYPYYGANGIQDHVADYIFDDELVLLAEDGGNFGSRTRPIAYRVSGKCWVNNHAHVLKPKEGLDVDFLCYSLMFYDTDGLVNGATRQKLTQATMRKMLIPDLPLEQQLEIVNQLNKVIAIRDLRQQEIQKLDELIKARFVEMFGDPIRNTQNRPTTEFINVVKMQRGFDLPVQDRRQDGEIPVYGSNGALDHHNVAKIQGGGVITGRSGTIGKVFYTEGDYWPLNTSLFSVDTHGNNVVYLAYLLQMYELTRFVEGTGVPTLNRNMFHNKQIIDVPIDEQRGFADFVKQVDKSKVVVQKALDEAQLLFDSLMQEYFG